jgi:hypothetical protein
MLVILATWEAEIQRIEAHCQPGQKVHETPLSCYPKLCRRLRLGGLWFQAIQGKKKFVRPSISSAKSWAWWYVPTIPAMEGSLK